MREIEIFNWDGRAFGLLPEEIAFGSLIYIFGAVLLTVAIFAFIKRDVVSLNENISANP